MFWGTDSFLPSRVEKRIGKGDTCDVSMPPPTKEKNLPYVCTTYAHLDNAQQSFETSNSFDVLKLRKLADRYNYFLVFIRSQNSLNSSIIEGRGLAARGGGVISAIDRFICSLTG